MYSSVFLNFSQCGKVEKLNSSNNEELPGYRSILCVHILTQLYECQEREYVAEEKDFIFRAIHLP